MKKLCFLITIFVVYISSFAVSLPNSSLRGVNGGPSCVVCTGIIGMAEQITLIHNVTLVEAFDKMCEYLPKDRFNPACKTLSFFLAPLLANFIYITETPDVICHALGFCYTQKGEGLCHLYPEPPGGLKHRIYKAKQKIRQTVLQYKRALDPDICNLPGIKDICHHKNRQFSKPLPEIDFDGDKYSIFATLRGTSWRGADCNDLDKSVHPGARPINSDIVFDSNCNGIYGVDPSSGIPYEDLFCKDSQPQGIAILGDSVGAHFHLPEEWFDSRKLSPEVFRKLDLVLENEFDWPELSTITGFMNGSWGNIIHSKTDSIYYRMWQRNRCNHRDYQNLAVNGARSELVADSYMYNLNRNHTLDYPIVVVYSLVGNDVCSHHRDFDHMTTPEQMEKNAFKTLQYLDTILPKGSHVVVTGLANGSVLYESLHNRIHPFGRLKNDVTYPMFYDYFNCLDISPCWGWMNSNATVRYLTTKRAVELSTALHKLVKKHKHSFKNFKIAYVKCLLDETIRTWKEMGGETWQLLEPVDGFHINQVAQALAAKVSWRLMEDEHPDIWGPLNHYNDKIAALFGDQGGYNGPN